MHLVALYFACTRPSIHSFRKDSVIFRVSNHFILPAAPTAIKSRQTFDPAHFNHNNAFASELKRHTHEHRSSDQFVLNFATTRSSMFTYDFLSGRLVQYGTQGEKALDRLSLRRIST